MNKKAIIAVKGGLGNQMFFFAFGEYLRKRGYFVKYVWHEYLITTHHYGIDALKCFNLKINRVDKFLISIFLKINESWIPFIFKKIIYRIICVRYFFYKRVIQKTPYSGEDTLFIPDAEKLYFDGFWQHIDYLKNNEKELRGLFNFNVDEENEFNKILKRINETNSVSIHIRRGDYLSTQFNNLNVINGPNYFLNAIELIIKKIKNPVFFVFSDDLNWAKKNVVSKNLIYVECNWNDRSYLDMYLMSKCKHNIISNSTFSFWGAYLNNNLSKIVICPDLWEICRESKEIWGHRWIYLKAIF